MYTASCTLPCLEASSVRLLQVVRRLDGQALPVGCQPPHQVTTRNPFIQSSTWTTARNRKAARADWTGVRLLAGDTGLVILGPCLSRWSISVLEKGAKKEREGDWNVAPNPKFCEDATTSNVSS